MMSEQRSRATSVAEMDRLTASIFSAEEITRALQLKLRYDDVVITPYNKSGTTWLQQIVHTLRTRGDMDFDDISRVVPWIETSEALGLDMDAEQRANPRAFKSHLAYEPIPKGGKYINSVRNPKDVLVSNHKFMEGWFLEAGAVSLEEFARENFLKHKTYWKHLKSWWAVRHQHNVLFLAYEQMMAETDLSIRRIAEFIDIPLDEELLALTLRHSSFEFMYEHKNHFDDAMMVKLTEERCGLPEGSDAAKVRQGQVGGHKQILSADISEELDAMWRQEITPVLGFNNYEALLAELLN